MRKGKLSRMLKAMLPRRSSPWAYDDGLEDPVDPIETFAVNEMIHVDDQCVVHADQATHANGDIWRSGAPPARSTPSMAMHTLGSIVAYTSGRELSRQTSHDLSTGNFYAPPDPMHAAHACKPTSHDLASDNFYVPRTDRLQPEGAACQAAYAKPAGKPSRSATFTSLANTTATLNASSTTLVCPNLSDMSFPSEAP
eukprot:jgi/Ulvmu1/5788/UM025_0042.1